MAECTDVRSLAEATTLALPENCAFSHATAALLLGLPLPEDKEAIRPLHVMRPGSRRVVCPVADYVEDTPSLPGFLLVSRGLGGDPLNIIVAVASTLFGSCSAI